MRRWLSGVLVVVLALGLAMGSPTRATPPAPSEPAAQMAVDLGAHACCTDPQTAPHDCATCAAIDRAAVVAPTRRLSRSIRYRVGAIALGSMAGRLPLPPPRAIVIHARMAIGA